MSERVQHIPLKGLELPEDDSYISFGLASELAAENGHFQNPESLTSFLVSDMFKGRFDPPPHEQVPVIYARDQAAMRTPMLIPQISLPDAQNNSIAFISHGWGNGSREGIVIALQMLRVLPFSLQQEEFQSIYDDLSAYPFCSYPEIAKSYLFNINIRKKVLYGWFEECGLAQLCGSLNGPETCFGQSDINGQTKNDTAARKPGRPPSQLWEFILNEGSKIRYEAPEMLNKCLAGQVQDIARAEFPNAQIPALATIQKYLSRNGLSRYNPRK